MENTVNLLAFGGARDIVGASEVRFELSGPCTVEEFMGEVCRRYPALTPHRRSIRLAVNGTYAHADEKISCGDDVALIPPVAGG
ncbi:MoaD/ThiS family protein [Sorangium sp. So ce693]|uniref:MoaD/ThiS family protein n=1 Tax=Sorangium sp. So ce693 TaxID=3133318 RepID=UPI003F61011D